MEKKILEFEEYLSTLKSELKVDTNLKEDICIELRQSLYDKFNELLIKGYSIDAGISCTLTGFEEPEKLAETFNFIYKEKIDFNKVKRFAYNKKAILAAMLAVLLMTFLI